MPVSANAIGKELIDALGLPKHTVEFTLRCRAGDMVRVWCEYMPDGAFVPALARYALVPRDGHPASTPDALPDFDAWMHARTEVAHADFMKRTSMHLACDWRVFTPEAISRYFGIPLEELA